MTSPLRFSHIPVKSIELADKKFMLSPQDDPADEGLMASIREYGLLHPPLILEIREEQYIIVSGRKRIQAFRQTHSSDTVLSLVIPAESNDLQVHSLLLEHSLVDGTLSVVEQTAFFEKLLTTCPPEEALPFLKKLGHKANRHKLDELLEMRNLCSLSLQALHEGIINYNNARKLLKLSKENQTSIVKIIRQLHLGNSKQQRLITLSTELIMRRNQDLKIILQGFPFSATMQKKNQANVPQQAAALLQWLHHQCYPRLTEAEAAFNRRIARFELPPDMQIHHTPAFEDDTVTLSIRYPDWDCFQQAFQKKGLLPSRPHDSDK